MKKILIILFLSTGLFSCNQQKVSNLESENDQLSKDLASKDSVMISYMESFNEIEQNLADIREREMSIALQGTESGRSEGEVQSQIKEDIKAINQLISQNKQKIQELNEQLSNSKGDNARLNKMLMNLKNKLNQQVIEKDEQIAQLKEELEKMNFTVEELNANLDTLQIQNSQLAEANQEKENIIEEKIDEINTAYLAMGTKKELEEREIISKEGGFLGIGKTEILSDEIQNSKFKKVDMRTTLIIPVSAKKLEFVTSHPNDSYRIVGEKDIEKIEILDPKSFWNNSKYLVVRLN
jgi:chromosome segregation ATPase